MCGRGAWAQGLPGDPAPSEAAACALSLLGVFCMHLGCQRAPINSSQVRWAASFLEEASAPMHLTNDRLQDGGEMIGSFHLLSVEQVLCPS